jgi:hypothetical protein
LKLSSWGSYNKNLIIIIKRWFVIINIIYFNLIYHTIF